MNVCVRRARVADSGDHHAMHRVYYRAVREGAAQFYTKEQRRAWAPSQTPNSPLPDPNSHLIHWLAEHDGQIIGFMSVAPDGYIDLAFVLPEWMGRGVADALYQHLSDWARGAGIRRLTTHASHLARRFFMRQGWQVDAPETVTRNGQKIERFQMSLELEM